MHMSDILCHIEIINKSPVPSIGHHCSYCKAFNVNVNKAHMTTPADEETCHYLPIDMSSAIASSISVAAGAHWPWVLWYVLGLYHDECRRYAQEAKAMPLA